jgi:hypothetical protein
MKKISIKQALCLSWQQWSLMASDNQIYKPHAASRIIAENDLEFLELHYACFLCTTLWSDALNKPICDQCPVEWGGDGSPKDVPCEQHGSLYYEWQYSAEDEVIAGEIADLFEKTLEEMKK